jgi:hypothetical protein
MDPLRLVSIWATVATSGPVAGRRSFRPTINLNRNGIAFNHAAQSARRVRRTGVFLASRFP